MHPSFSPPAKRRPTAQHKTAPKGRLTWYAYNCLRFLASRHSNKSQQAGAKLPHRSWYRHRADIARMNSQSRQKIVLEAAILGAGAEIEDLRFGEIKGRTCARLALKKV